MSCGLFFRNSETIMTIRIGTSERDGTFYSQGQALKTIFQRSAALVPGFTASNAFPNIGRNVSSQ